jgi:hypothetical protein
VALSVASFAMAQTPIDPPTPAQIEEFRHDLTRALQEMDKHRATLRLNKSVQEALAKSNLASAPPLAEVEQQLQKMTYEELSLVYRGFATAFPNWREAPQALGRIAGKFGGKRQEGQDERVFAPSAITPDNCQNAFDVAPSWTDWGVTEGFAIGAQGAYEVIPAPLNAVALVAWVALEEGANAAEILNLIFERCQGDNDVQAIQTAISDVKTTTINNANSNTTTILTSLNTAKNEVINNANSNRTILSTAISNAQTAIVANDNSNTTTIVNNDNANKTAVINNDNANKNELRDLLLRTQIEADLAEADSATPVAWYLTPTANGGHLDLVQTIVTQTLANILAAGGSISNAQSFLDQANAQKAAGQFKDAYQNYRKAYKLAAN